MFTIFPKVKVRKFVNSQFHYTATNWHKEIFYGNVVHTLHKAHHSRHYFDTYQTIY